MEKLEANRAAMSSDTSGQIGKLTEGAMPILDFLTLYWPYDLESKSRQPNPDQTPTPEFAVQIMPAFIALEEQYIENPNKNYKYTRDYFGLTPSDVSSIVNFLYQVSLNDTNSYQNV